jgi:hypothetical protein
MTGSTVSFDFRWVCHSRPSAMIYLGQESADVTSAVWFLRREIPSKLIDLALQKPRSLGYPFALWALVRLQDAFEQPYGRWGTLWVLEALEPATGQATTFLNPRRDSPSYMPGC